MAIFKPVNCTPYSNTFDISKEIPYYFECEIDCSNIQVGLEVNGYSLTILDEDNNQVFPLKDGDIIKPVDNISLIDDLKKVNIPNSGYYKMNSGLNGTYLKIPVVVNKEYIDSAKEGVGTLSNNWIETDNDGQQYVLFSGKSYKWIITLFQGVNASGLPNNPQPTDIHAYDMLMTQGEVLGSYQERIHSKPSQEILPDYFIQLKKITGKLADDKQSWESIESSTDAGTRVMISAYDYTLGLIYPQTGAYGIASSDIGNGYQVYNEEGEAEKANAFAIYKMSNNPDELEATRKVDILVNLPYTGSAGGSCYIYWTKLNSNSASYLTQVIQNYKYTDSVKNDSATVNFINTNNGPTINRTITTKSRIVFNRLPNFQFPNNSSESTHVSDYDSIDTDCSPFNGIYFPAEFILNETTLTIKWYRTSDANTWGTLGNKLIYDNESGQNYQGQKYTEKTGGGYQEDSEIAGVINQEFFKFITERPLKLYGSADDTNEANRYGVIFYNEKPEGENPGTLYVKPFSGLEAGQLWMETGASITNPLYFYITAVDKTIWKINYQQVYCNYMQVENESFNFNRGTRYQIKTWFRASDENFFTIYDEPVVKLEIRGEWKEGTNTNPRIYFPTPPPQGIINPTNKDGTNDYELGIFKPYVRDGIVKPYYYIPVNQRNIRVVAKYQQNQFLPWKTFQWFLQDENDRVVSSSEIGYNGQIETVFYGLVENVNYTLVLQLEDQTNTIWIKKTKIQLGPSNIIFESKDKIEGADTFKVEFNKQTASVSISAPSHGTIPQNDNNDVYGASEENNFYQSFDQEIIFYIDKNTIAEALASLDGSHVRVSGQVTSINRAWSDVTNDMTVTISDSTGSLQIIDLPNFVEINDIIRVKGTIYKPSISVIQMIQAEVDRLNGEELTPFVMSYSMRRDGSSSLLNDAHCLNIEFLADKEKKVDEDGKITYDTEEIYYNSVFSSELSQEQQRPLAFDNHFIIKSKHVLGTTGDNQSFQGEIFGFQIEFNDYGGHLDYSYVMQDPFTISKGEYIPNKNRGKLSLLQSEHDLYNGSINRDEDFYKTNDYYYQNLNNSITYYNVNELGAVVSEAHGVSQNYLCISVWQPIDYVRYSYDLVNIIPISTPWIVGETDYGIIASSFIDQEINPNDYAQWFQNSETGELEKQENSLTITLTNNTITLNGYWKYESMNSYKVGKEEKDIKNRAFIKLADYNTIDLNSIKLDIKWNGPAAAGTGLILTSETEEKDRYVEINSELSATRSIPVNKIGSLYLILPNETTYKNLQISIEQIDNCRNILGPLNIYGTGLYDFNVEPTEEDIINTPNLQIPITATNDENSQQSYGSFTTSDGENFTCLNTDEYVVYQHSPILWTDVRCNVAKVIEHQFQEEIVGEINSNAEGKYRLRNVLMENSHWAWNDIYQANTANKSSWIWRDSDAIEDGSALENQSILKLQKEMAIILPERQELVNNELTFHTEGIFNAFDYIIPQYDINTIVYIKNRAQEE